MFHAAMANQSTAPHYVLVTIHDARTDSFRLVCIEAPFLEGALRCEHNVENSEAGQRRLLRLIFEHPDHLHLLESRGRHERYCMLLAASP